MRAKTPLGKPEDYFIKQGYEIRPENVFFDDTPLTDEYQDEVYQYARLIADRDQLRSICDIGCGSGFKLLKYFSERETLGMDLPPTVAWLKAAHPDRRWCDALIEYDTISGYDLAIASDMIEHLVNPDTLLDFIERSQFKRAIISTPERDKLAKGRNGPPHNCHHIREWNSAEFVSYIGSRFKIEQHQVSKAGTQFVECSHK
jgi:SAM-dependent methyltransferase